MPPAKKRKTEASQEPRPASEQQEQNGAQEEQPTVQDSTPEIESRSDDKKVSQSPTLATDPSDDTSEQPSESSTKNAALTAAQERLARFRALQARAKESSQQNLKEATKESQRLATDPSQLTALSRKHAIAAHKLLKAEIEDAGGDFERKRAWDWTVEEAERWDKRMKKKEAHRDDTAFRDYAREAEKTYKRQIRNMGAPDLEKYMREKLSAIEKAAAAGTLDIIETEDGEMIAVDKDGTFFSTANATDFAQHKPDKAAVDRLVADLRKAEEASLKRRREKLAKSGEEHGDVTYINEKNKQFNAKLARFYNKYTAEIRDSFERGTMV